MWHFGILACISAVYNVDFRFQGKVWSGLKHGHKEHSILAVQWTQALHTSTAQYAACMLAWSHLSLEYK